MSDSPLRMFWIRRNMVLGMLLLAYVFAGLCFSFYPLEYKATTLVSFNAGIDDAHILHAERAILLSDEILQQEMEQWKLHEKAEYNPALHPHKLVPSLLAKIEMAEAQKKNQTLQDYILEQLKKNIEVDILPTKQISISVRSISPWLTHSMANSIAQRYKAIPSSLGVKVIDTVAEKPVTPDLWRLKHFLFTSTVAGIFLGLICVIFVTPKKKIG